MYFVVFMIKDQLCTRYVYTVMTVAEKGERQTFSYSENYPMNLLSYKVVTQFNVM